MRPRRMLSIFVAALHAGALPAWADTPLGVFLWYPDQARAPSSADCDALVARVKPSREKADAWLWGRAPFGSEMEFYLFLNQNRMEPTYAAEGDYDSGALRFGDSQGDEYAFELIPDDHPTVTINGTIVAPAGSSVITVILRDVPSLNGTRDRTSYFCRFGDDAEA